MISVRTYFPWKTHLWFWMIDKYHKKKTQHYLSNNTNSFGKHSSFMLQIWNMNSFFGLFEYDYKVMMVFGRNNYKFFGVLTVNRVSVVSKVWNSQVEIPGMKKLNLFLSDTFIDVFVA